MLGRRKTPVLAEVPPPRSGSGRLGALGRAELDAYAELVSRLDGASPVLLSGPAKSAVALGLAAAGLAAGRRVALLECDLAAPTLAGTLGLRPRPGLREYLDGEAGAGEIVQPLLLAGPASGRADEPLVCVVAGREQPSPVALIDSERCDHAIAKLRNAYELLIVDGPPLEEDPDSLRALAEHAGKTLVCGERSEIPRRLPMPVDGMVVT